MNKAYIEIWYTYENRGNNLVSPSLAIVEVEIKGRESVKNLADKAMDRLKEKYPDKALYMVDCLYLGDYFEVIPL